VAMDDAQRNVIADLTTASGFALVETELASCWRKAFGGGATCSIAAGGLRAFDDPASPVWAAWIVNTWSPGFQRAGWHGDIQSQLVCRARTLFATLEAAQDRSRQQ
jgi:hypothetical protein